LFIALHIDRNTLADVFLRSDSIDTLLHFSMSAAASLHGV
jgi:hypothetical protein